jgi:26S proteasome regulatory subunit N2
MFLHLPNPDYLSVSQCYVYLNKSIESSKLIKKLITGEPSEANILTAYQIAFDLRDSATQHFINQLLNDFIGDHGEELKDFSDIDSIPVDDYVTRVRYILTGELGTRLYLEFLSRHNHVDLTILRNTKHSMDSRNSLCHSALSFANAFMNCGTTSDQFLRMNLEWLSRATNWSKFTATAALGVIHKGNIQSSMKILTPYLPQEGSNGSPYSEGGALLGLGFIHSNHGSGVLPYLLESLKSAKVEVIQHGAALGLGVAGIATDDEDIYEALKGVLFTDSAVAGQAAGLAMGLIMLGTGYTHVINEMLQYAHETQHEKIIMGLSVGISLINYGLQEKADPTIDQLCSDKDHLLRYGGMYTIAMAYCGTGDNKMIRRLLHVAVSDVSDDVRRAAVTALGFILFKTPEQVPRVVQLLSESYNPHVRYGATLALGISCAGTGLAEAIEILEPMTKDPMDYVRQGALIALAMVLIQQTDVSNHKVGVTRKLYESILSDKHEDLMAKFGASLGQGIIDAGGRNLTISLQSQLGCTNMPAIVGMALFTQFWFWFPMAHFISLAFKPTTIIGIDQSLKVPEFVFKSNARPSLFAYPPKFKAPTASVVEKAATAVLSTTAKAKARAKKREKSQDIDAMDVDEKTENVTVEEPKSIKSKKEEKDQTSLSDQTSETVPNMHRVLPFQIQHVQFLDTSRYQPIKQPVGGFIMLSDKKPHKAPRYIYPKPPSEKKEDKKAAAATSEATSTSAQPAAPAPAPSTTTQEQSGNAE